MTSAMPVLGRLSRVMSSSQIYFHHHASSKFPEQVLDSTQLSLPPQRTNHQMYQWEFLAKAFEAISKLTDGLPHRISSASTEQLARNIKSCKAAKRFTQDHLCKRRVICTSPCGIWRGWRTWCLRTRRFWRWSKCWCNESSTERHCSNILSYVTNRLWTNGGIKVQAEMIHLQCSEWLGQWENRVTTVGPEESTADRIICRKVKYCRISSKSLKWN